MRVKGDSDSLREQQGIVALWHNRIFTPCYCYRYKIKGRIPMSMLTSASKDGALLSTVAGDYGMRTVRGSSRRRGAIGFLDMVKELQQGCSMCITPDGPKGPIYKCHPGVVKLAALSGVPIVPLRIGYHASWRIKSWDRFFIPLPFSKVTFELCEPIHVPRELSDDDLAAYCAKLEAVLHDEDPPLTSVK